MERIRLHPYNTEVVKRMQNVATFTFENLDTGEKIDLRELSPKEAYDKIKYISKIVPTVTFIYNSFFAVIVSEYN